MFELEDEAIARDLSDPVAREATRERILEIIRDYRAP
jgi:hypothetical protein